MTVPLWVTLTPLERDLLEASLSAFDAASAIDALRVADLLEKLRTAHPEPKITVGVHGGVVQWVQGNPFPIRICDYDGDRDELLDVDGEGNACSIWFEQPNADA